MLNYPRVLLANVIYGDKDVSMKYIIFIIVALFSLSSVATADLRINGLFRNDYVLTEQSNKAKMSDILENRLILSRRTDDWRFYSDLRLYLLYGEARTIGSVQTNLNIPMNVNLMRAFLRFYSSAGDFTIGKTYVNFGKKGVFNPFEMNKSLNFNDLSYDKEGILALLWDMEWSDNIEMRAYASPKKGRTNSAGGISVEGQVGTYDIGIVYNRKQYNRNVAGLYFQGDLLLGVHGAWAYHCDDYGHNPANELNLGLDYSFFGGKLILAADYYYAEAGATNTNGYVFVSDEDRYLQAAHYVYANISYVPDEFLSVKLSTFVNCIDGSVLFIPVIRYTIFDGMDLTLQGAIPLGRKGSEFDPDILGNWSADIRCEAKL